MLWMLLACFQENPAPSPGGPGGPQPPAAEPQGAGEPPPPGEGPQPLPLSANPGNSSLSWTVAGEQKQSEGFRVETDAKGETFRGAVHLENGDKLEFEVNEVATSETGTVATVTFEVAENAYELDVPITVTTVDGGLDIAVKAPLEVEGQTVEVDAALSFRSDEAGQGGQPGPGAPPPSEPPSEAVGE